MRSLGSAFLVAASLCASPVFAADMPLKRAPINTEPSMWDGLYAGGHIGYGFGAIKPDFFESEGLGKLDPKGFIWGGQVGFNTQFKNVVFGVESDLTWLHGKDRLSSVLCDGDCGVAGKLDFVGSLRARLGLANGGWLFYGTFGLGLGHSAIDAGGATFGNTLIGWTGGAGIETKLNKNWSLRAQYLHYDFGKDTIAGELPVRNTLETATIGLNYHFRVE